MAESVHIKHHVEDAIRCGWCHDKIFALMLMLFHSDRMPLCRCAESVQVSGITMTTPSHNRPMPDLSTIKAVLFDVDGTLTNSDPLHFKAFQEILLQYNYKVRLSQAHHPLLSQYPTLSCAIVSTSYHDHMLGSELQNMSMAEQKLNSYMQ